MDETATPQFAATESMGGQGIETEGLLAEFSSPRQCESDATAVASDNGLLPLELDSINESNAALFYMMLLVVAVGCCWLLSVAMVCHELSRVWIARSPLYVNVVRDPTCDVKIRHEACVSFCDALGLYVHRRPGFVLAPALY